MLVNLQLVLSAKIKMNVLLGFLILTRAVNKKERQCYWFIYVSRGPMLKKRS